MSTLISKADQFARKLEEVALVFPILDSQSYAVHIRRYWDILDGPRPTRTGVAMTAGKMLNLVKIVLDFHSKIVDKVE